jgi:hypothetical protein
LGNLIQSILRAVAFDIGRIERRLLFSGAFTRPALILHSLYCPLK